MINLAAGDQPVEQIVDVASLFDKALQNIYKNHGGTQPLVEKHLFEISNKTLQHGIDKTFITAGKEFGIQNADFIAQFKSNAAVFNAFKNHLQTKEIAAQLLGPDRKLRSFGQFKKEALNISKDYNKIWLQTEYNTAVRSARMAANWKQFERTKHLYPNLEYRPSASDNPRDSHKQLWHKIRSIDDPFWDIYMPPSDWNCKCSVRAVKGDPTSLPEDLPAVAPVFRNNPGKTAEIVNLREHTYYKQTDPILRDKVTDIGQAAIDHVSVKRHEGKDGGFLDVPTPFLQFKGEKTKNLTAYKILADRGYQYKMLNIVQDSMMKNPDAYNIISKELSDVKVPITSNIVSALQNNIASANKQKVAEVVFHLQKRYTVNDLEHGLYNSFIHNRNKNISTVIFIYPDKEIKVYKVTELREAYKIAKGKPTE